MPYRFIAFSLLLFLVAGTVASATAVGATPSSTGNHIVYLPLINKPAIIENNILPNASFEGGWYHPNGIPELQIPNEWQFNWLEGDNPLDPDPWNDFVRPEVRVLPSHFLPPAEHDLFIWDGNQTIKVFKGHGAISFELSTKLQLAPGTYTFRIHVFPDLVVGYDNDGQKIWAPDYRSGEVQLYANGSSSGWLYPTFGAKNRIEHTFTITTPQTVRVGAKMRGRWAIRNNGWFMDDWSLFRHP